MGLIDRIFGKRKPAGEKPLTTVETFTAYSPVFTSWGGQLYESALVREAIYAKARHIMKLKFDMIGSAQRSLYNAVKVRPNPWSTWPDFLERCNNIYETENNLMKIHMMDSALQMYEDNRRRLVKVSSTAHIDGMAALLDAMTMRRNYYTEMEHLLRNERR